MVVGGRGFFSSPTMGYVQPLQWLLFCFSTMGYVQPLRLFSFYYGLRATAMAFFPSTTGYVQPLRVDPSFAFYIGYTPNDLFFGPSH